MLMWNSVGVGRRRSTVSDSMHIMDCSEGAA